MEDAAARVLPTRSSTTWTVMCLEERVTTRRGRSAVPATFLRPRACLRSRDAVRSAVCLRRFSESAMSLTCLSDLASDLLAGVPDALALVGLGLAQLADVGCDLTDELLVDALDREAGGVLHREGDAFGCVERDRVGVAELELQLRRALGEHAVADADDLEALLVALGHPDHHVVDQRAGQPVQGPAEPLVVGALDVEYAVVTLLHDDRFGDGVAERPLGT